MNAVKDTNQREIGMNSTALESENRFLFFRLGSELYATPLMAIREVVEYQKPKPVANTVESFVGVMNIRGEIVGAIDLRMRLGLPAEEGRELSMMVFAMDGGSIAAIVDRMEGVAEISPSSIDSAPRIEARVPLAYLHGIAQHEGSIVTLLDLAKLLTSEDVVTAKQAS